MTSTIKDTVPVNINSKIPFLDVKIDELDVNNIVLNSEIVPSKDPTISSNFTFAYYMKNGKPHRFTIVVYGRKGLPIHDVSFAEIAQDKVDKSGSVQSSTSKRVIMDIDYHNDAIHKSILDALLAIHSRILSIISRTPALLKLAFSDANYNQYLSEYMRVSKSGDTISAEDFWFDKLSNVYPEDKFISKDLYLTDTTMFNGESVENRRLDENGLFVINDKPIPCFLNFRERRDKEGNAVAVLIDKDRKKFLFDDVKGFTGILGKLSLDVGMTNLMKSRGIKIHSTVTGGFLMSLTERSGGMSSYIDDVDPALMVSGVEIPTRRSPEDSDSSEDYNDMVEY